jgi:plastocyanin
MSTHYIGDNPEIFVLGGTTIAFNLNGLDNHPFQLQHDLGDGMENIVGGLTHVDVDGTTSYAEAAQQRTSGTLYWNVPITGELGGYQYICSIHSAMAGTITHKSLSSIA